MKLPEYKCKRCGHTWTPRSNKKPVKCPACISVQWDRDYVMSVSAPQRKKGRRKAGKKL